MAYVEQRKINPQYRVGTTHFTSHAQVEDVKLSRKVLYYFAIDSIVNEILIFEYR